MTNGKANASFMRSLCFGEIAEDLIFPFPEMVAEEKATLAQLRDTFATWLKGRDSDFRSWDEKGELPPEFLQEMRDMGLFSLIVPEAHGGLGFSSTAYSRAIQELVQYDAAVTLTAGAHSSIGMRGLLLFGTEAQKQRYYPRLATGEMIAAFCLTEAGAGSDAGAIKTKAVKDGKDWVLTGEKIWITNGGIADFFTVFARTDGSEGQITAFLVTRDMPGVSTSPHEDKMGIRASSTTSVRFDQVRLSAEQVLGEVGKGFKIAMNILNNGRTGLGGGCVGMMKKAIALSTRQAVERRQFGKSIAEFGLIKQKIGNMVVACYASEATVAMVAGLIDKHVEDYAVEAAISKVFASECLWRSADQALQIAGGNGYMREFPYERMLRDARINRIFEGTNEILRLFIALTAMNDVGRELKEVGKSLGNALADPIKGFGVLSEYARRRVTQATGYGQATLSQVHPVLKAQATVFDDCTRQLAAAVDRILRKHGRAIVEKQFATRRLADIMIDLFVLASVLSRVTAAINAKGVAATTKEQEIAAVFCRQAQRRVKGLFNQIDDNDDEFIKSLADYACDQGRFTWDNL